MAILSSRLQITNDENRNSSRKRNSLLRNFSQLSAKFVCISVAKFVEFRQFVYNSKTKYKRVIFFQRQGKCQALTVGFKMMLKIDVLKLKLNFLTNDCISLQTISNN